MKLEVLRFSSQKDSTLGVLLDVTKEEDKKFLCFTLEDEYRTKKVYSKTRIPAGTYEVRLKSTGSFHKKYLKKYWNIHKGMLSITNVPNFQDILIHVGNRHEDTAGCLLVGDSSIQNVTEEGMVGSSGAAYKRVYKHILDELLQGKKVFITYKDYA